MSADRLHPLSIPAQTLLDELRAWVKALPPGTVVVTEEHNPNYGGLLFEVKPVRPDAMNLVVGLGSSEDIDMFWGDGYRWEGWTASTREVLEVCNAIRQGRVVEETWRLG